MWRRLAEVGNKDLDLKVFNPTQDLMDFITLKLNKSFPNLNINWDKNGWNPILSINDCPTQISMEKLGLAYQGLINITDELNAQVTLANIIVKKLKELFI